MYAILCASGPSGNGTIDTAGELDDWSDSARVRGTLGGSDGPSSAYGVTKGGGAGNWYDPGDGATSTGSIGYGGG